MEKLRTKLNVKVTEEEMGRLFYCFLVASFGLKVQEQVFDQ